MNKEKLKNFSFQELNQLERIMNNQIDFIAKSYEELKKAYIVNPKKELKESIEEFEFMINDHKSDLNDIKETISIKLNELK